MVFALEGTVLVGCSFRTAYVFIDEKNVLHGFCSVSITRCNL